MQVVRRLVSEKSLRPESQQVYLLAERFRFLKRSWMGTAEDGREFQFDLESRLTTGCVIHREGEIDYIIVQKPEPVYRVTTPDAGTAAVVGWQIGNLHFPVQIVEGFVLVMAHGMVRTLLDREGWDYEEVEVVFHPLKLPPEAMIPPPQTDPSNQTGAEQETN